MQDFGSTDGGLSVLQIKERIEDNSKIIFLISLRKCLL